MDSTFSEPFRRIFRLNGLDRLAVGPAVARFRHLTVLLTDAADAGSALRDDALMVRPQLKRGCEK